MFAQAKAGKFILKILQNFLTALPPSLRSRCSLEVLENLNEYFHLKMFCLANFWTLHNTTRRKILENLWFGFSDHNTLVFLYHGLKNIFFFLNIKVLEAESIVNKTVMIHFILVKVCNPIGFSKRQINFFFFLLSGLWANLNFYFQLGVDYNNQQ